MLQHIKKRQRPATNQAEAKSTPKSDESIVDKISSNKKTSSSFNDGLEITDSQKSTPKHFKRKPKPRAKKPSNDKQNFTCTVCKIQFENKSILIAHKRSEKHLTTTPVSCPVCDKMFTHKFKVIKHHSAVHLNIKPFMCEYCSKCFGHRGTLVNHLKCHTDNKPFQCADCGKAFRRKSNLRLHLKSSIHTKVKEHMCSKCGKKFYCKAAMQKHEEYCSAENITSPNDIIGSNGKSLVFVTEEEINQYKSGKTSFKSKPKFICFTCGKVYCSKINLEMHEQNQHSIDKQFSCDVCPKRFGHLHSLKMHLKTHKILEEAKLEKRYTCSLCEKKFISKILLIRHEQMHRGIKLFSCSFCNARFTQTSHLQVHLKVHQDVRNFKCCVCDKGYITKGGLLEHETTKHGINAVPVTCDVCHVSFPHKYYYYKHARRHSKADKSQEPGTAKDIALN